MLKKKKKEQEHLEEEHTAAGAEHTDEGAGLTGEQTAGKEAGSETASAFTSEEPSPDETEKQASETEKLREELAALNDRYLRLYAEFDNFKRRSARERIELINTASKGIILALLPVLDDFDRAQQSMERAADIEALKEGVNLISSKLKNILAQQGLKEMEAVGQVFDADLHEAISNIPAPSEDMKGKVIDQAEKGYYLNDKVIRFAKVFVGA